MEIKSTSAKSRIRLLEAKLAKLETAYREYAVKASIHKLKENPKVCSANETNEGSGEAMGSKGSPPPTPSLKEDSIQSSRQRENLSMKKSGGR